MATAFSAGPTDASAPGLPPSTSPRGPRRRGRGQVLDASTEKAMRSIYFVAAAALGLLTLPPAHLPAAPPDRQPATILVRLAADARLTIEDRKSTRLHSSH